MVLGACSSSCICCTAGACYVRYVQIYIYINKTMQQTEAFFGLLLVCPDSVARKDFQVAGGEPGKEERVKSVLTTYLDL